MKIVKEHINEIKQSREVSGLGSIGIGSISVNKKLKDFVLDDSKFVRELSNNKHNKFISKQLELPIENIVEIGYDYLTYNEYHETIDLLIHLFGEYDNIINRKYKGPYAEKSENEITYHIWKFPTFLVKKKPIMINDGVWSSIYPQVRIFCNKNIFE